MDRLKIQYKFPPILQPRCTWRYCLSSIAVAYVVYCFIFNKPFFSSKMPRYTGIYGVGTIDIEVPVREPRLIHDAVFKDSNEPAFKLETVLFSLYYPTYKGMKSKKPHHYWVPKPLHLTAIGYAKFAHVSNILTNNLFTSVMGILVGSTKIPAEVDVPLFFSAKVLSKKTGVRVPISQSSGDGQQPIGDHTDTTFPIIIFSHGMASSRTQYSQYLSELASRGYICAAIEHRDGSGPGTQIISTRDSTDSKPIDLLHFDLNDIKTNPSSALPNQSIDIDEFKHIQLTYREAEILEVRNIIHSLNDSASAGADILKANSRKEGSGALLASGHWTSRLNTTQTILAGHSYGATGILQALKPRKGSSSPFFCGGIALDPGKSSGHLNSDIDVPLLIIHSTSWSSKRSIFYGRPHFETVRDIAANLDQRSIAAWFMTSLGTSHPSVTDAPLLEPTLLKWTTGASIDVQEGVRQYVYMSDDFGWFLRTGEKRNLLACKAASEEYNPDNGRTEEKWRTFWQVHVSPVR